ncbi:MAG: NAD(P)-dependent oxidoreductase [Desulfobacteraceae bacterium]|nr:NAD(P)-dependent oxidoreductase [Desulfobacteraceae bacterium]
MLKIVLLGGTGFIGSATLRKIRETSGENIQIHALIRRDTGRVKAPFVTTFEGCLPGRIPKELFPKEPHVVVHFATKQIDTDNTGYHNANVKGTKRLLESLPPSAMGVIYGSSMSVYGQGEQACVTEQAPGQPETKLSKTRAMAESLILNQMRQTQRSGFVLRPRFILGQGDRFTLKGFRAMAAKGIIIGTGKQSYSIIDVDDYADIIISLAQSVIHRSEHNNPASRPLNIGYRTPVSLNVILNEICKQDTFGPPVKRIPVFKGMCAFLRKLPVPALENFVTKLDLVGHSHSGDVSALEQEIGSKITAKDSTRVFRRILSASHKSHGSNEKI